MLTMWSEVIPHLVYGGWEYCVQHDIKWSQNLQIPKLDSKIKTNGLIQDVQVTIL